MTKQKTSVNIQKEDIIFLGITTWIDAGIFAKHYYGRLKSLEGDQSFDVTFKLSKEDVEQLGDLTYKEGNKSSRFTSEKKLIIEARRQFREYFPKAKVLVLGDKDVIEPQLILIGPKQFKSKINRLASRAEKIDYWDNEEEMEELCRQWQEVWPIKYREYLR